MQPPFVAVVILTCNQTKVTLDCLTSLQRCRYEHKRVILVDNGSEEDPREIVKKHFENITVIRNDTNLGASGGRNIGIDYAFKNLNFQYILFMDNDVVVAPDFLVKMVEAIEACEDPAIQLASPMLYRMGTEKIIDSAGGAMLNFYIGSTQSRGHGEENRGQYDHQTRSNCVPTTAVLMHRQAVERAKGYDVSFDPYGYEDLDMALRANVRQADFLFVPSAIVHHRGSKTGYSGYTVQYAHMKGKNMRRFLKRHATSWQWLCFNVLLPFLGMKSIVRELKKGNIKTIFGLVRGFLSGNK
jgi:GT2 family glycosyltransferase